MKTPIIKNTTAEDIRIFLNFWPSFIAEGNVVQQKLIEDKNKLLSGEITPFSWCHLYELPIKQHESVAMTGIVNALNGLFDGKRAVYWLEHLGASRSQVAEIPNVVAMVSQHFDEMEDPSEEQAKAILVNQAVLFGNALSMFNGLQCVLFHGCFLNELIERVRTGDDKALFKAVRIDPTVIGCSSVIQRISTATILKEEDFFKKLKNAINGKQTKREQANFQMMRLVLEILHETGANRLSDKQLEKLFVKELKLYSGNARGGGNAKALRKFADTYMKENATT